VKGSAVGGVGSLKKGKRLKGVARTTKTTKTHPGGGEGDIGEAQPPPPTPTWGAGSAEGGSRPEQIEKKRKNVPGKGGGQPENDFPGQKLKTPTCVLLWEKISLEGDRPFARVLG